MEFKLTEEQLMIQQAARDFANNECLPGVIDRDDGESRIRRLGPGCHELCFSNGRNK